MAKITRGCESCGKPLTETRATAHEPYIYELSGLKNARLIGITVYKCKACKSKIPLIPQISQLHSVIGETLLHAPNELTGDELRFLRKHAGLSTQAMAQLMEMSPAYLSRVERNHTKTLGKIADRLFRLIIEKHAKDRKKQDLVETWKEQVEKRAPKKKNRVRIERRQDAWQDAA